MKIKKGDMLEIELPSSKGEIFNLKQTKGKKVLLTFYRIASCSCLLYTSPSPRDVEESRMPSSA